MLGCDSRIGHLHDCHCSSDPTSLVANGPFDRNACIAIDVSRYFMHRRICQTPCQTQELVLAHCQLGKVTLLAKWLGLISRTESNITIWHIVWLVPKSQDELQVAGAPVVFPMSRSHRFLTFLLWHILVTGCTPERLKPLTQTWTMTFSFLFCFFLLFRWLLTGFLCTPSRGPR
jgi:hypothetical protein